MLTISSSGDQANSQRQRTAIVPLSVDDISNGNLQEGQELDFKREVDLSNVDNKSRLLDDIVAFLNRGPSRIIVGVEEKGGRYHEFRPLSGDPDKVALRFQTLIQDCISPVPLDIQVVPIHLEQDFLIDIQIPQHHGGPFVNRLNGAYLIRSGARNLPIDPGMLRSRFVDETSWMNRLNELTIAEDAAVAENSRVEPHRALRIAILPREHFDYMRAPFTQSSRVRYPAPSFSEHGRHFFVACEDGHEARSTNFDQNCIERLFIREDWFVHAQIAYALGQRQGEGMLALHEFETATKVYFNELAQFFNEQEVEGPFAVTIALHSLGETENFGRWFERANTVRTLRPRLVSSVNNSEMVDAFLLQVRQASRLG